MANDPTKDLASMEFIFWGKHQNGRKTTLNDKKLSKFLLWLDATWHAKPHLGTLFGELELKAFIVIKRAKFCPPKKHYSYMSLIIKVVYKCCGHILGYGYPFTRIMAIIFS
jgi:hypothetical protein